HHGAAHRRALPLRLAPQRHHLRGADRGQHGAGHERGRPLGAHYGARKSFDLLALQQGTTALLGEGEMPAGQYHAVRMTIDTSLSSITWNDAAQTPAQVNWHGWSTISAFVEYPVNVPTQGADIVLDFDVGRSFQFNFYNSNNEFDFTPQLRAINSAAAGAIAGVVTQGANGTTRPASTAPV